MPLAVFVAFACAGLLHLLRDQIVVLGRAPSALGAVQVLCTAALIVFALQQAVLCLVRFLPLARASGITPRVVALASAYCGLLLALVGREPFGATRGLLSFCLSLAGTAGAIATLAWLGRSFSILPQARQLVTRGPYAVIRHPLYLMESIAFLGVSLQFRLPWSLLVFALSAGLQLLRIEYEEDILLATFPTYAPYRAMSWRLIPFVY